MKDDENIESVNSSKGKWKFNKKIAGYTVVVFGAGILLAGGWYGYLYASTSSHLRKPTYQHYHFRTQILVEGQAVDFSQDKYQKETGTSTTCSAAVGGVPIDFHDKMDQLTHVHWNGMTGGEFLKYFGWNYIGGRDDILGQRYDDGIAPSPIKIYGDLLPVTSEKSNFYVYIGDTNGFEKKNWDDFIKSDIETFFGKKSNIGHSEEVSSTNFLNWVFPRAYAHGEVMDEHDTSNKSEEELTRINNLVGNVVIFAQEKEPSDQQIKARFDKLVPLHESTCGD